MGVRLKLGDLGSHLRLMMFGGVFGVQFNRSLSSIFPIFKSESSLIMS